MKGTILLAVAVLALIWGCGSEEATGPVPLSGALAPFAELEGGLDIAGGTAHIPVMKEAAKRIMTANRKIRITVAGGGSGVGVQKVGEGLVHIGNTGRPVSAAENERYGLRSFAFAVDGVAVIVHPGNPVRDLTSRQVRDIFAGKITRWKEVGGPDERINLYGRDEASGTRKVFWTIALQKGEVAKSANVVPSNGAMKTAVSNDPCAIGYMSIGHVDGKVAAVGLDGIAATQANARDGTYPVTRKLFMNTRGEPGGLTRAFLDYVLSDEGAAIVQGAGYLPLSSAPDD
jgi:phosphate transport system substrate-binding protein